MLALEGGLRQYQLQIAYQAAELARILNGFLILRLLLAFPGDLCKFIANACDDVGENKFAGPSEEDRTELEP